MPFPLIAIRPGTRLLWLLPLLCLLASCGGGRMAQTGYAPASMTYPEPGPPEDPWRPYIRQAGDRFSVPQQWIRAVMHQESGGHEYRNGEPITSGAGAMGLMQLMPATYADLQSQYGLGSDPFEPHDNIMAGTAYIRQMYQKYGAPAFLAAYNAGPQRLDDYLSNGRALPNETVDYVASIAPNLGTEIAMTGPLAAYAGGGGVAYAQAGNGYDAPVRLASYQVRAGGRSRNRHSAACWHDPDAAYDPAAPCQARPVQSAVAYAPVPSAAAGCVRDPDAAYDAPCGAAPVYAGVPADSDAGAAVYTAPPMATRPAVVMASASYPSPSCARDPDAAFDAPCESRSTPRTVYEVPRTNRPAPMAASAAIPAFNPRSSGAPAPSSYGNWAIQVGAFVSVDQARFATTMARQADYSALSGSQSVVQQTSPFGHGVLYRARLAGLARNDAGNACSVLKSQNIPCMVVNPGG